MFSPTSQQAISGLFDPKGRVNPQNMLPIQAMIKPLPGQTPEQQQQDESYYGEEYGDEEYGEEAQQRVGGRQLTPEQEDIVLKDLILSAAKSKEFLKVLNILQNDRELRPLIFEHEALLRALKDMSELKAEQMLCILTAAETEMYETKKNEESQMLQRSQNLSQGTPNR